MFCGNVGVVIVGYVDQQSFTLYFVILTLDGNKIKLWFSLFEIKRNKILRNSTHQRYHSSDGVNIVGHSGRNNSEFVIFMECTNCLPQLHQAHSQQLHAKRLDTWPVWSAWDLHHDCHNDHPMEPFLCHRIVWRIACRRGGAFSFFYWSGASESIYKNDYFHDLYSIKNE